jgi:hypothetical protein
MTGQEAVDLLLGRCGNNTDTTFATLALAELKAAQTELEGEAFKPWFLEQFYTTAFATTANTESVALPSTFLLPKDEGGLWYQDTTITTPDQWVKIERDGYSAIQAYYKDSVSGPPEKYDIVLNTLYFRPFPDAAYSLKMYGFFADSAITLGGTNLWFTHAADYVIARAGFRLAGYNLQNKELANTFGSDVLLARDRLRRVHEAKLHTDRTYSMGDD